MLTSNTSRYGPNPVYMEGRDSAKKCTLLSNLFLPQELEENSLPFPTSSIYNSEFTALVYVLPPLK